MPVLLWLRTRRSPIEFLLLYSDKAAYCSAASFRNAFIYQLPVFPEQQQRGKGDFKDFHKQGAVFMLKGGFR